MTKSERLKKIVEQVARENKVSLESLSKLLKVSNDTIRRDIRELSDNGLLKAVRGGAIHTSPLPPIYKERELMNVEQKNIIALKVLEFIKPDQVILIDAGTTTTAVTQALPKNIPLTVITHSLPVASILTEYPLIEVLFIGGQLNKRTFSMVGYETIQAIRGIRADLCLMGICSIDLKAGITGADYQDSQIKKAMIETSKYIIATSVYEKVGNSDPYYICAANAIDVFVTDKDPSGDDLNQFKEAGVIIK